MLLGTFALPQQRQKTKEITQPCNQLLSAQRRVHLFAEGDERGKEELSELCPPESYERQPLLSVFLGIDQKDQIAKFLSMRSRERGK